MNRLTVTTHHRPHGIVLTAEGDMDLDARPALEEATRDLPLTGRTLHMDLSAVSFLDSSGLTFLLALRRRVLEEGGRLRVTGLRAQPASVLRLTRTYPLLVTDATAAV